MGLSDKLSVNDGVTIALGCGRCGAPVTDNHLCFTRYLRNAAVVRIRQLPHDLFEVRAEDGGEEYVIKRETFERDYQPL